MILKAGKILIVIIRYAFAVAGCLGLVNLAADYTEAKLLADKMFNWLPSWISDMDTMVSVALVCTGLLFFFAPNWWGLVAKFVGDSGRYVAVKTPDTKTWINKQEALKIVCNSAIFRKKSPRRDNLITIGDVLIESLTKKPSLNTAYVSQAEKELSFAILHEITSKHPSSIKSNKHSKEVIKFALSRMLLDTS